MSVKRVREGYQLHCGFNLIKPDAPILLILRPRGYFKPAELIVTPLVAQCFWLVGLKIGFEPVKFRRDKDKDFRQTGGRIPLDKAGEVPPALDMVFTIINRSPSSCFFYGEVWGDLEVFPDRETP